MKDTIIKTGQFLRILDENQQISMTNAAMYISLFKLAAAPQASYGEIGTFLLSAALYAHKKTLVQDIKEKVEPSGSP